jgi:hypothetical protein
MRYGLISLLTGVIAIPFAATATYAQSARVPGSGVVLQWLERLGFLDQPTQASTIASARSGRQMTEAGYFSINDGNMILLLLVVALLLSLAAIAFSFMAERKGEGTLNLAVGFMGGVLSLLLISPYWGLLTGAVGVVALMVLRQHRAELNT